MPDASQKNDGDEQEAVKTTSHTEPSYHQSTDLVELEGGSGTQPKASHTIETQAGGGQLLQGEFDEEESRKSFQEALNDYRQSNKAQ